MEKLTKSLSLFKERNCSVSVVLDSRTRRKNACEFPLSLRFTIDRKFFYLTVGSSFTERKFSDICNATKCKSENYKLQKEWKDSFVPKYKEILMNLNKGGILTFEMVRQCIMSDAIQRRYDQVTNFCWCMGTNHPRITDRRWWCTFYHSRELRMRTQIIQKNSRNQYD